MTANLALCSPHDPERTVLFGKKIRGFGYCFSFFTPLTPTGDSTVSVNMAYWFALNSMDKTMLAPGVMELTADRRASDAENGEKAPPVVQDQ